MIRSCKTEKRSASQNREIVSGGNGRHNDTNGLRQRGEMNYHKTELFCT